MYKEQRSGFVEVKEELDARGVKDANHLVLHVSDIKALIKQQHHDVCHRLDSGFQNVL